MRESASQPAITPAMVYKFARTARERVRRQGVGYRRDHFRALAQPVEVADKEVRIMGSKGEPPRTPAADSGHKAGYASRSRFHSKVAEEVGFEPTVGFHPRRFSRPLP